MINANNNKDKKNKKKRYRVALGVGLTIGLGVPTLAALLTPIIVNSLQPAIGDITAKDTTGNEYANGGRYYANSSNKTLDFSYSGKENITKWTAENASGKTFGSFNNNKLTLPTPESINLINGDLVTITAYDENNKVITSIKITFIGTICDYAFSKITHVSVEYQSGDTPTAFVSILKANESPYMYMIDTLDPEAKLSLTETVGSNLIKCYESSKEPGDMIAFEAEQLPYWQQVTAEATIVSTSTSHTPTSIKIKALVEYTGKATNLDDTPQTVDGDNPKVTELGTITLFKNNLPTTTDEKANLEVTRIWIGDYATMKSCGLKPADLVIERDESVQNLYHIKTTATYTITEASTDCKMTILWNSLERGAVVTFSPQGSSSAYGGAGYISFKTTLTK